MSRVKPSGLIIFLAIALPVVALLGLMTGTVYMPLSTVLHIFGGWLSQLLGGESSANLDSTILLNIRLPRILLALAIGSILAVCGAVMQGLFRNPLADPSLIGVSGGASVGASVVIVIAAGWLQASSPLGLTLVAFGAFLGGFLAVIIVYRLATSNMGTSVATMLLAGIAIAALAGALNNLLSYVADDDMLRQISLWQMGNLSTANWSRVALIALACIGLLVALPRDAAALNALLLGESEARYLGVDVQRVKRRLILLTAFGVGVSVAVAGLVSFVGLVVPHVVRLLIGPDHRWLLPGSALLGGVLLIVADSIARVIVLPAELPTGILTALLGAPFFVALLVQQRKGL